MVQWSQLLNIMKSSFIIISTSKKTDGTVSYLKVYIFGVTSTNNNDTYFPELTIVSEAQFEMKVQERYVLKYIYLLIFQSPLGFSVDSTDSIMEIVN